MSTSASGSGGAGAGGEAPLLDVRRVTRRFGGLVAVNAVDFTVHRGRIVSLIGPNGAGKTTLFNMVAGFHAPTSGGVFFEGRPIHTLQPHQITARGIARTFQNIRLFGNMTVLENVLVGMHCRLHTGAVGAILRPPWYRRREAEAQRRARRLLEMVNLGRYAGEVAANLPYGMQRRLEVARALGAGPSLLLLDEPTAGMNPQETVGMIALIRRLRDELGVAVLLIEHDMSLVMGVSERVTVLNHGQKIAEGSPQEVQRDERVVEAYLGRRHAAAAPAPPPGAGAPAPAPADSPAAVPATPGGAGGR